MNKFTKKALPVLPITYGLIGLLFLGLQLKTLSIDANLARIQHPFLVFWGLLSLLFLIPRFSKLRNLSLLHSSVFLFVLVDKIIFQGSNLEGKSQEIKNYMSIYSISLVLDLLLLLFVMSACFLLHKIKYRSA